MKKQGIISLVILVWSCQLFAQPSILEKSGKRPNWTQELEKGFVVGIGTGMTIQQAQDNAILNIKAQIVSSVADNIISTSELKNAEITTDKVSHQFQSYSSMISSRSGEQNYLMGISKLNVSDSYWEKLMDKQTKNISYQYFVKYPFSPTELSQLVFEFKQKDQELTDELEKMLSKLQSFSSIEEILDCQATLTSLYDAFIDQRKTKAQIGIEKCNMLLASVIIQNEESSLGNLHYGLYINNKRVTTASRPIISAPCAVVEDKKLGTEVCELHYRYDECFGDADNKIKLTYNFGSSKSEQTFFFDISENKADLNLIGSIRIGEGNRDGEAINNAKCKIELSSKYDSPVTVSNITFDWKQFGLICDIPVNETFSGKGIHVIEFSIPGLTTSVSTVLHPENKLNGTITYSSGNGKQTGKIRIYQKDYITSW